MAAKTGILDAIGQSGLLLAERVREGLTANDRIKAHLTDLQDLIARHRASRTGGAVIPGASRLRRQLIDDVRVMLAALEPDTANTDAARTFDGYAARLRRHADAAAAGPPDELTDAAITSITGLGDDASDSLHRLVMDLHRELNARLATLPIESIDGAAATALIEADRVLVRAFMKGLHATMGLKFDHPGLATTAARYAGALSIQNDLGTTDAHVIVIRIGDREATVTYSDVHRQRVRFLQRMLERFPVTWEAGPAAADGSYQVVVGRFRAETADALAAFLEFAASRLVFLIDWNRARKQLQQFVSKDDAVALLEDAAHDDIGHRAFLQAGGAQLVYDAFERAERDRIRVGMRLDELIGRDEARAFLRSVLRLATAALAGGRSVRLIQDQVQAELMLRTQSAERQILDRASDHAMLLAAITERLRRTLSRAGAGGGPDDAAQAATRARAWEARADAMVRRARDDFRATADARFIDRVLVAADRAVDRLEEASFLLTLVPEPAAPGGARALSTLAGVAADAVREYVRCLAGAAAFAESRGRVDLNDALVAADRIVELEHASDAAERTARAALLDLCADARSLTVLMDAAHAVERAVDALAGAAFGLRDALLDDHRGRP